MPTAADNYSSAPQFPLNAVGNRSQNAFLASTKMFFTGATGLVATFYGSPGHSATRVRTGVYAIKHPSIVEATFYPALQGPTGVHYGLSVVNQNPYSGTAELHITQPRAEGFGTGLPSMTHQLCNPISGTRVNLLSFNSPIAAY